MIIERLVIEKTYPMIEEIRSIKFKKGLNLIVDEREKLDPQISRNNIGKTTLIKIIDICLSSTNINRLYEDGDTKSINKIVKDFLEENKVQARLQLKHKEKPFKTIEIVRPLYENKGIRINGQKYNKQSFVATLNDKIFGIQEERPTFRQIIHKFIRVSSDQLENMFKFLNQNTKSSDYEIMYHYLFSFGSYLDKNREKELNKEIEKIKKINKNILSIFDFKDKAKVDKKKNEIDNNLMKYNYSVKKMNSLKVSKYSEEKIREIILEISNLNSSVIELQFDIDLIKKNIQNLEEEKSTFDLVALKEIYEETKLYVDDIHKSFEEMVKFHNYMLDKKKEYIASDLEEKENKRRTLLIQLANLSNEKESIERVNLEGETFEELLRGFDKYGELSEEKGKIQTCWEKLSTNETEIRELNNELEKINEKQEEVIDNNNQVIKTFNSIFTKITEKLYEEPYCIEYVDEGKNGIPLTCPQMEGNFGTGKKKAMIIAYDLAYIKFANRLKIRGPKFITNDQVESVDSRQLEILFDIANHIDGQLIIPVLSEKLVKMNPQFLEECKIVGLSENDKLFRM